MAALLSAVRSAAPAFVVTLAAALPAAACYVQPAPMVPAAVVRRSPCRRTRAEPHDARRRP